MLREFCDLSGDDITKDVKFEVTILRIEEEKDDILAMRKLIISAHEFVELKKFLDSRQK